MTNHLRENHYYRTVTNYEEWRAASRPLLQRAIPPDQITWQIPQQDDLCFNGQASNDPDHRDIDLADTKIELPEPRLPKAFFQLARSGAAYREDRKWSLLYRVAWRLVFENRRLLGHKIDEDIATLNAMRKAVGRDIHKMEAFVRFRRVDAPVFGPNTTQKKTTETFVAWFEPDHLIVPLGAPFFVKRFTAMNWSILTPDACAHWDQKHLRLTPGIDKNQIDMTNNDSLEDMWLTYYRHIFNPARLKLDAMRSEMPIKYWKNLPEATLIKELSTTSASKTEDMLENSQSEPSPKNTKSKLISVKQHALRTRRVRQVDDKDPNPHS